MLVVMKAQATPEEIQAVCEHIEQLGFRAHPLPGAQRTAIGITGNQGEVDRGNLEELSGVAEVIRVSKAYKLASRDVKEEDTVIRFPGTDAAIGGRDLAIVAGPARLRAASRPSRLPSRWLRRARSSSAAALTSRALRLTRFRAWALEALQHHGRDSRALRAAHRHRGDRQREPGPGGRVGRRDPDWRAQHAEFFAAEEGRASCASRCCSSAACRRRWKSF